MTSPIAKLTVAAVLVGMIGLGIFEFVGTGRTSGVVWAEVARKMETSRGMIYRMRQTQTPPSPGRGVEGYTMWYELPGWTRTDDYEGDRISSTMYVDYDARTMVFLWPETKKYLQRPISEEHTAQAGPRNPTEVVQKFLSAGHKELGQRLIEGVLCEGIEVTDASVLEANFQIDSFVGRLWVSVETGYPTLFESEVVGNGGQLQIGQILDRFQWDVALDATEFKVSIPSDYTPLE